MSHLPLPPMNRQSNRVCCFQSLDAVFPKHLFSDYLYIKMFITSVWQIYRDPIGNLHTGAVKNAPFLQLEQICSQVLCH